MYYSTYNVHIQYAGSFQQYPTSEGHIIKVKVEYQGYISQKMAVLGGISVSQTHLVFYTLWDQNVKWQKDDPNYVWPTHSWKLIRGKDFSWK